MQFSLSPNNEGSEYRKRILTFFFYNYSSTIPELARELNLSIPTVTKLINEMVEDGIVNDCGKGSSKVGRKPNTYKLNPKSGYFLGIDLKYRHINIGICDFNGEIVCQDLDIPYTSAEDSPELLDEICVIAKEFVANSGIEVDKILNACLNISGRVNSNNGYSYSKFNYSETPLNEILTLKLGINTCIENDTRSMTYGEFLHGAINGEKNILYVNLGWGLGIGMIINGQIYEGKSGFAGEFGHIHAFDNEIICHCGKKGCLETEVSGAALHRQLVESVRYGKMSILSDKIKEAPSSVALSDIIEAIREEDFLCIDILESISEKLGRQLANMINIFNPELVVIGGTLSAVGEYIINPIRQAIAKHSLKLVSSDTKVVGSKLKEKAGVIGACMIARRQMFEKLT